MPEGNVQVTAGTGTPIDVIDFGSSNANRFRQIVTVGDGTTQTSFLAIDASGRITVLQGGTWTNTVATAAKGTTAAGNPTSANIDANTQAYHVQLVGTQAAVPLSASATQGAGLSTAFFNALLATVTSVKAAAGKLHAWSVYNPNTSLAWVQFFDLATGSVTLGTTTPKLAIPIPPSGAADFHTPIGVAHATAISIAATTTATGLTAPGTGLVVNVGYI